jgi:ATP-binding cassette subfamily B protein/subfamily B ATP-binding cassette protein MsbA
MTGTWSHRYRFVAQCALRKRSAFASIIVLNLLLAAIAALTPWPLKLLVDFALGNEGAPDALRAFLTIIPQDMRILAQIVLAGALSILLFSISSVLDFLLTTRSSWLSQGMMYETASCVIDKCCRSALTLRGRRSVGDTLSRISVDAYSVYSIIQGLLIAPLRHGATLASVAVLAWFLEPRLTLLAFVMMPLLVALAFYAGPWLKSRSSKAREAQSQLMTLVQRTLTALPMVQAYGAEDRNRIEFETLSKRAVDHSLKSTVLNNAYGLLNGLLMTVATAIVLFVGSQRVLAGTLTIGSLLVLVAYLQTMRTALVGLAAVYGSMKVTEASLDRVCEVLESEDIISEGSDSLGVGSRSDGGIGEVRLEGVTVGYEAGRPVLKDVSLSARAGETIALVGPTGSGKSTLASLLPRFLDPWEGRVTIGGKDVRELSLSSLRSAIGMVLQESFLLPISVAANIAYGRPEASRAEIVAAAEAANADEFIRNLPDGYDTIIGERGSTLSGGQGQRLSIARALLKDAPILILDEPTSALDAQTEASLLEALKRLMQGRTTFIIAHRMSTIRHADRILVIKDGRIVEAGTHEKLQHAGGYYEHASQLLTDARIQQRYA